MVSSSENPWTKAKEIIIADYKNKTKTHDMSAQQVYKMNSGFAKPQSRRKADANPWHIAKPIVCSYYIARKITDEMDIKVIHTMEEFNKVKRLKTCIKENQGQAEVDIP
eukprot:15351123-Ditylum_brightwellii.AAC.1